MALTIDGLLLARAARGTSISEEMLSACRCWALPEARGDMSTPPRSSRRRTPRHALIRNGDWGKDNGVERSRHPAAHWSRWL